MKLDPKTTALVLIDLQKGILPFAGGPHTAQQVLDLIESIREQTGTAVLFITHDLRVAAQICNTIVVMKSGKIVEAASAHEVLSQPRDAYTRQLIDAAPGRHWDFQNFRPAA